MSDPKGESNTADKGDEKTQTEYIEFLGSAEYGTEFYRATGTHTVNRKDVQEAWGLELGHKEVVWRRGRAGRFLVPASEFSAEVRDALVATPEFKLVSL